MDTKEFEALHINDEEDSASHQSQACPVCLDLDYSLYHALTQKEMPGRSLYFVKGDAIRYRVILCEDMVAASENGCRLCDVVRKGVEEFWAEEDPDSEGEEPAWRKIPEWGIPPYLLLVLRPGEPLLVCRGGFAARCSVVAMLLEARLMPGLEFYSDAGAVVPFRCLLLNNRNFAQGSSLHIRLLVPRPMFQGRWSLNTASRY